MLEQKRFFFCKKFRKLAISCRTSNVMFEYNYRQSRGIFNKKSLQSQPFQTYRKIETPSWQWYRVKRIKHIFTDKGNSGRRHLLITLSSSYFFNKPISSNISLNGSTAYKNISKYARIKMSTLELDLVALVTHLCLVCSFVLHLERYFSLNRLLVSV